ncbi:DMT family transporter [Stappia sp.]|uniref:DMT family transporter n=1 Tax=Stappia sp. TaxID=1870903 RepID=UPI0032D93CEC
MSLTNWALLITLSILWGGTFLLARIAVVEVPPLTLVFLRVALAALTLHAVLRVRGLRFPLEPRLLGAFAVMGLLNNAIPFSLIFWGQTVLTASLASILNATTPIFTVIVAAAIVAQEPLRGHRIAGIAVGFAGVVLLLLPGLRGLGVSPVWAQLLCLGGALSYAFAATFARRFRGVPVLVAAAGQLSASSLLVLPLAAWQAATWQGTGWAVADTGAGVWLSVVALGTLCTALAYLIYFRLLVEAGATNASLVTLLIPVTASVLGALTLGESLTGPQLSGMAVLLVGLALLDGRILRWRRSSALAPGDD